MAAGTAILFVAFVDQLVGELSGRRRERGPARPTFNE
jgi:hypothetical protein